MLSINTIPKYHTYDKIYFCIEFTEGDKISTGITMEGKYDEEQTKSQKDLYIGNCVLKRIRPWCIALRFNNRCNSDIDSRKQKVKATYRLKSSAQKMLDCE